MANAVVKGGKWPALYVDRAMIAEVGVGGEVARHFAFS
jgi:hypothetical protein